MQLDARLHNENTALHEELHDLSDVLTRVQPLLDVELSKSVDVALLEAQVGKDTINVPYQQVSDLRAVLVKAMKQLPAEQHSEIRGYLSRQIERDGRSLNIPIEANPF